MLPTIEARREAVFGRAMARVGTVGESVDKAADTAKGDFTNVLLLLGGGFGLWLLLQYAAPASYHAASKTKSAYRKYKEMGPKTPSSGMRQVARGGDWQLYEEQPRSARSIPSEDVEVIQPSWYRAKHA